MPGQDMQRMEKCFCMQDITSIPIGISHSTSDTPESENSTMAFPCPLEQHAILEAIRRMTGGLPSLTWEVALH